MQMAGRIPFSFEHLDNFILALTFEWKGHARVGIRCDIIIRVYLVRADLMRVKRYRLL